MSKAYRRCSLRECYFEQGESVHEIPSDELTRTLWIKQLEPFLDPRRRAKMIYVCCKHFEEDCYRETSRRRILKPKVIPTIFNGKKVPLIISIEGETDVAKAETFNRLTTKTGHSCCVPDCTGSGTTLFRFPIPDCESAALKEWVKRIGMDTLGLSESKIYHHFRVCDLHFSIHCRTADKSALKKGSLPTLFCPGYSGKSNAITSNIKTFLELQQDDDPFEIIVENDGNSERTPNDQNSQEEPELNSDIPFFRTIKAFCKEIKTFGDVCRICLKAVPFYKRVKINFNSNRMAARTIQNMLAKVLPELDQKLYSEGAICLSCHHILVSSYQLKEISKTTEETLQEILVNKNYTMKNDDLIIEALKEPDLGDHNYARNLEEPKEIPAAEETGPNKSKEEPQKEEPTEHEERTDIENINSISNSTFVKKFCRSRPLNSRKHTTWGSGPYLCDVCGFVTKKVGSIRGHVRNHVRGPSGPGICELCGQFFKSVDNLQRHFVKRHKKIQECDDCDETFSTLKLLRLHKKSAHSNTDTFRRYQCHFCGFRTHKSWGLRAHLLIHNTDKIMSCHICDKNFHKKRQLQNHLRTHCNTKYECPFCDKSLKYKDSLRWHIKIYHTKEGRRNECDTCNRRFWSKAVLQKHKIVAHGWGPLRDVQITE